MAGTDPPGGPVNGRWMGKLMKCRGGFHEPTFASHSPLILLDLENGGNWRVRGRLIGKSRAFHLLLIRLTARRSVPAFARASENGRKCESVVGRIGRPRAFHLLLIRRPPGGWSLPSFGHVIFGEEFSVGAGGADFDDVGGFLMEEPWVSPAVDELAFDKSRVVFREGCFT